jgi:hypothetical protein
MILLPKQRKLGMNNSGVHEAKLDGFLVEIIKLSYCL